MNDSIISYDTILMSSQFLHPFAETTPLKPYELEQITYGAFLLSFLNTAGQEQCAI